MDPPRLNPPSASGFVPDPKDPAWIQSRDVAETIQAFTRECFDVRQGAPYSQPGAVTNFLEKVLISSPALLYLTQLVRLL